VNAIKEISGTIEKLSEISSTIAAADGRAGCSNPGNFPQRAAGGPRHPAGVVQHHHVRCGASETGSASSQVLSAARSLSSDSNRLKLEVGKFLNTVRAA
jgi:methyl-accepting chemotaxis protein